MRLLFLTNVYPTPWQPGRGSFNARLVAQLRTAGHQVEVVVPVDWREYGAPRPAPPGVDARWMRWWHPIIGQPAWESLMWWSLRHRLLKVARAFRPEMILTFWVHPDGGVGQRLAQALGIPCAVMTGGSDLLVITRSSARRRAVTRVLSRADLILTNGTELREAAVTLGADPARTLVFQRGVDKQTFTPGERRAARDRLALGEVANPVLISVGNLVPVKGHDVLLRALAEPSLATIRPQLYLIGDGPSRESLEQLAARLRLTDQLHFIGRTPHEQLVDWYRAADLLVLPSLSEGTPNVLLEALATGTPFVASAVGEVPRIAPAPDWCVPAGNPTELAIAIARQLAEPAIGPWEVSSHAEANRELLQSLEVLREEAHAPAA